MKSRCAENGRKRHYFSKYSHPCFPQSSISIDQIGAVAIRRLADWHIDCRRFKRSVITPLGMMASANESPRITTRIHRSSRPSSHTRWRLRMHCGQAIPSDMGTRRPVQGLRFNGVHECTPTRLGVTLLRLESTAIPRTIQHARGRYGTNTVTITTVFLVADAREKSNRRRLFCVRCSVGEEITLITNYCFRNPQYNLSLEFASIVLRRGTSAVRRSRTHWLRRPGGQAGCRETKIFSACDRKLSGTRQRKKRSVKRRAGDLVNAMTVCGGNRIGLRVDLRPALDWIKISIERGTTIPG